MEKIGAKLYCYNFYNCSDGINLGKYYTIVGYSVSGRKGLPSFFVIDDFGANSYFSFDESDVFYYGKCFYTISQMRKFKLKKINKNI